MTTNHYNLSQKRHHLTNHYNLSQNATTQPTSLGDIVVTMGSKKLRIYNDQLSISCTGDGSLSDPTRQFATPKEYSMVTANLFKAGRTSLCRMRNRSDIKSSLRMALAARWAMSRNPGLDLNPSILCALHDHAPREVMDGDSGGAFDPGKFLIPRTVNIGNEAVHIFEVLNAF